MLWSVDYTLRTDCKTVLSSMDYTLYMKIGKTVVWLFEYRYVWRREKCCFFLSQVAGYISPRRRQFEIVLWLVEYTRTLYGAIGEWTVQGLTNNSQRRDDIMPAVQWVIRERDVTRRRKSKRKLPLTKPMGTLRTLAYYEITHTYMYIRIYYCKLNTNIFFVNAIHKYSYISSWGGNSVLRETT